MALSYTVREGLAGFGRAKFAAFAATSAMSVALVLVGMFGLLVYHANYVAQELRQRVGEIEIFLEDVEPTVARALQNRALATPGVDSVRYVSKEEARRVFVEEFGEGGDVFLDTPFLPASLRVRVTSEYATADSLARLAAQFERWTSVDEVFFNQPLLVKVQENLRFAALIGLTLGLLVVLASLFLVSNTIRLTIYARRLLIRTMKLVGATDRFIRQPFLVEGITQGLAAGLLAGLLVWMLYRFVLSYVPQLGYRGWPGGTPVFTLIALLLVGAFLGWLGSLLSVRRFLNRVEAS